MQVPQIVLILDANPESASRIQDFFIPGSPITALSADNVEKGLELAELYEPDLIIVHDNFDSDIADICLKIRKLSNMYRPVIMVLSASDGSEKKIELLRIGADDFQNDNLNFDELSLRIFAHLRRHTEELTDPTTKLPYANLSYRILKRNIKLKENEPYALMYLDVDNLASYREVYGYIAAEKLLQTFIAIVMTSLDKKEFFGKVGENDFVIFTTPEKAEKISMFLSYYFDMVAPKFYSNRDINRGYLILDGDEKVGRRIPLVSVSIGITTNQYKKFSGLEELINSARAVHRLAKSRAGSSWVSDHLKISGTNQDSRTERKILVVENDASLAYLLVATLEMQGYSTETVDSPDKVLETIEKNMPELIIFDISGEMAQRNLEICSTIKKNYSFIRIIVSTADCSKETILDSGVDLYIPKPYELIILFNWISRFLNYEVAQ